MTETLRSTKIKPDLRALIVSFVVALVFSPAPAGAAELRHVATTDTGPGGEVAFWGDLAVLAHGADDGDPLNDGIRLVDVSAPSRPRPVGSFTCPGSAYDVGVWENLVILSANEQTFVSCDRRSGERSFAGLRIISIADPARPIEIASVPTNCGRGSHTSTLLPDLERRRLIVYANGHCENAVVVPLDAPERAHVAAEMLATTEGCHDVNVHVERRLAVCSNQQVGAEIWDLANPLRPQLIGHAAVPGSLHHHNSIFSNDGRTLAIGEEAVTSPLAPACGTGAPVGSIAFYDITNPEQPVLRSRFQLPRPGAGSGLCTSHQFNVVPLRSQRDVLVAAWYRGGTSVVDFTDARVPREIAHWQAPSEQNAWSSYWYRDHVFSINVDIVYGPIEARSSRGMDILRLEDAGLGGALRLPYLNAQTQMPLKGAPAAPRRLRRGPAVFGRPRPRATRAPATPGFLCRPVQAW